MSALIAKFLAPYLTQIVVAVVLALMAGGGFVAVKLHYEHKGYARAVHDVATQNREAVDAVNEVRGRVRACNADSGMRWDQVAGECVGRD